MNNSFEKQIKDKVNGAEVSPSEGLLDSIFEKRAAKARPVSVIGKAGWILAAAVLVVTAGVLFYQGHKGQSTNSEIAVNSPENQPADAPQVRENPAIAGTSDPDRGTKPAVADNPAKANGNAGSDRIRSRVASQSENSGKGQVAVASDRRPETLTNYHSNLPKNGHNQIGYNADIDPNAYFNVDALNRPVIDREKHKGNSHMYVYQSVDPRLIEDAGVSNASLVSVRPFKSEFESPEMTDYKLFALSSRNNPGNKKPLFIDLIYAPGMSFFHATDGRQSSESYNQVNSNGMMSQYGLRISHPVYRNISVFTGLYQVNQSTRYKGELPYELNEQQINQHITYINDPLKGVVKVVTNDTQTVRNSYKLKVDYNNQYSLFRLPLGLSYNFGLGRFDFAVNAAMDLNYLSSAKGSYFNPETRQLTMFSLANRSVNIGSTLSFLSAYKLSNKFRLIVEPGMHYMSLKGKNTGHVVNERILNFNMGLGLRYTLF